MTRNYYDALDNRWSQEEVEELVSRWREQESRLTARVAELEAFVAAFEAWHQAEGTPEATCDMYEAYKTLGREDDQ